ncbi:MAG: Sapep family Mn(2+)-dependent dipeptidase [Erysipelotrichaceae bacterium]|nr:Sapep family Mn(2+)-dependent dipeptidase [Erysipelotrichaceae bacterium]MDY6034512.1 Sapep family Mn(2+)-dependent dipeptidase [Bulleidia sp.]
MKFLEEARAYQDNMIEDLRELVKIESVRDDQAATKEAPFGPNILKCLNKALQIGERDGFKVENVDGYAGVIQYGDLEESVGVLGHLDVVPIGDDWTFDPLGGEIKDGYIMGRGTCDDKGPAIAAYYAIKILKDKGYKLKHNIQMILGTDEENTSAGILYYKKVRKNPIMGIVPDAEFPCIYAEKGILDFKSSGKIDSCIVSMQAGTAFNVVIGKADVVVNGKLEEEYFKKFLAANGITGTCHQGEDGAHYHIDGKPFHASKPYMGINAAVKMFEFVGSCYDDAFSLNAAKLFKDAYGVGLGVAYDGAYMGPLTFNLGKANIKDGNVEFALDYRYPNECDGEDLLNKSASIIKEVLHIDTELVDDSKWLLNDPNSELIQTCLKHYREFSGDTYTPPLRIGGGTYARSFENFAAFGPIFPTREHASWVGAEHEADEGFEIETMLLACAVYANVLYDLACEHE